MDKKAWIIVSLCIGILGFNFWNQSQQEPEKPASDAPAAAQTAAPVPAPAQGASSDAATAQLTTQEAATEQPTGTPVDSTAQVMAPATPVESLIPVTEIASLTSHDSAGKPVARYSFSDVGGSIRYVEMCGKAINSTKPELQDDVRINGNAPQGIGTLIFDLDANRNYSGVDKALYKLTESSDKHVVLEGEYANFSVRKEYRLKPLDGSGTTLEGKAYIITMNVTLRSKANVAYQYANYGVYCGATSGISSAEGPNYIYYVTNDDGDFEKASPGSFNSWFSADEARRYPSNFKNLFAAGTMNQYYAKLVYPDKNSISNAIYAAPIKLSMPQTGDMQEGVELVYALPKFQLPAKPENGVAESRSFSYDIYTGPKLNMMLNELSSEYRMIDHIMDYGWLTFLSYPMNWLINVFHGWFGNWGLAIICMTLVVRILIWPLYKKSYMSMKRMSLLQPKMKELKEQHPNEPQKVNMAMMKLYKEYGISPLGGCLPMLLQIPIFFAFFYVLQTAAEFRGAPFIGWVSDLSQMDTVATLPLMGWNIPINILPFLMLITMMLQMRMTPTAGDPTQVKIMRFMPILFFFFCYSFPSALALYWTTQNILSIAQTFIIQRLPQPELKKVAVKNNGKKGFMQRMMEAQQAQLAEQQKKANMRNVTKK